MQEQEDTDMGLLMSGSIMESVEERRQAIYREGMRVVWRREAFAKAIYRAPRMTEGQIRAHLDQYPDDINACASSIKVSHEY